MFILLKTITGMKFSEKIVSCIHRGMKALERKGLKIFFEDRNLFQKNFPRRNFLELLSSSFVIRAEKYIMIILFNFNSLSHRLDL